jgi:hypothetical protein
VDNFRYIFPRATSPASRIDGRSMPAERLVRATAVNDGVRSDPDLAAVVRAWDRLPDTLKAAVMAIVRSAWGAGGR